VPAADYELNAELRALRKGRGVHSPDLDLRLGPHLRALCHIDAKDDLEQIRDKVSRELERLCGDLPQDLSLAARVAFGLDTAVQYPFMADRVAYLAHHINRDSRTVRRRMDMAINRITEATLRESPLLGSSTISRGEWYVERCETVLRMDTSSPEAWESRQIVVTTDAVDSIELPFSVPREPGTGADRHDLQVEIVHGGIIESRRRATTTRFDLRLRLPKILRAGDRHDYTMLYRIPEGQIMSPRYVYIPVRPCQHFKLRVRFSLDTIPENIWEISEELPRDIDDDSPARSVLFTDSQGEVAVEFHGLQPGYGYGLRWDPLRDTDDES
jgi:hypothetical protein